jgi:hypothetical protein
VQHEQASRTALLIAASLVLLHHDAKYSRLVSKTSADLRPALANGIAQVVILGAGFDPLSSESQGEFPTARFWEIDHPATPRPDLPNFLAQATDLLRSNRTTVIYGTVRLIEKVLSAIQRISGPEAKVRSS